ncbi:zinc finger CCCH domain-containing protein 18 isoform X2 [Lutzomyia longipalpis]|uniref:Putative u4/u6-associated splicing factor prp4 n=1 Tax=Lutzomyia longipalpis TaxID=7200 RepID=A0A7G3B1V0_LUTLO|nr:zinc finger CCCH domain-containing protein 18 isoform X2 [Lutzomyia longipalpis]XP_055693517.1 zinc finger CCCH domain-containing protein 18 isoform X2 [Lutzomyia longipalpis]XP_055693518.1 zinc finger CCCH domain-containing protein 18 isoform X2 [Lutzomyia longipalpis]XP_055693519.1 zinc finger CCCH domain-containing protein 18 isoform X2 [Lutzomyia longipalpis]
MDSDEESQQGSPVSNSPSSPQENASNSDGSDTSDSDSNDSAPNDNSKTTPNAISREHSSSRSSDSSNESFRLASPEMPGEASHDASQDASRDAHEPEERAETPAEVNHGEDHHDELEEDEKHDGEDGEHKEEKEPVEEKKTFDLAHEDLSDVSDVDSGSSLSGNNLQLSPPPKEDEDDVEMMKVTDLREKLNARKKVEEHKDEFGATNGGTGRLGEEKRTDEDALDFEAEDGECADDGKDVVHTKKDDEDEGKVKEREEELEEGEVTDDDDRRPEETEPKPVCRFYARGQCTWGVSCRFLHPGVTDKGNYTMFDMVRPIAGGQPPGLLPGPYERYDRPKPHIPPVHHAMGIPAILPRPSPLADPPGGGESPWERGLRTAKEMLRKANKRKEQDLDFEDKKMNLSTGQDDLDREYYSVDKGSPELSPPAYPRAAAAAERFSPPPVAPKYPPRQKHYMEEDAFGRTQRYRELPPHRMPQYEDERRVRPVREVIVQRSEPVRDDEWNDPWMRSKSPAGRGERPRDGGHHRDRSFSSKSYSSSSSSQSESSSDSSRSKSPPMYRKKEKKARSGRTSKGRDSRKVFRRSQSPEKRYSYGRGSVGRAHSPVVSSNKRALERISASQHPLKRRKVSSPKETRKFDRKPPRRSKSSSSGSSDSSASDSESSGSSSSDSSGRSGGRKRGAPGHRETPSNRHKTTAERPAKPIETKEPPAPVTAKKTTRREELLKQLKAVEDAIARKRSKISS